VFAVLQARESLVGVRARQAVAKLEERFQGHVIGPGVAAATGVEAGARQADERLEVTLPEALHRLVVPLLEGGY
jgi:hypothetical protein